MFGITQESTEKENPKYPYPQRTLCFMVLLEKTEDTGLSPEVSQNFTQ